MNNNKDPVSYNKTRKICKYCSVLPKSCKQELKFKTSVFVSSKNSNVWFSFHEVLITVTEKDKELPNKLRNCINTKVITYTKNTFPNDILEITNSKVVSEEDSLSSLLYIELYYDNIEYCSLANKVPT